MAIQLCTECSLQAHLSHCAFTNAIICPDTIKGSTDTPIRDEITSGFTCMGTDRQEERAQIKQTWVCLSAHEQTLSGKDRGGFLRFESSCEQQCPLTRQCLALLLPLVPLAVQVQGAALAACQFIADLLIPHVTFRVVFN